MRLVVANMISESPIKRGPLCFTVYYYSTVYVFVDKFRLHALYMQLRTLSSLHFYVHCTVCTFLRKRSSYVHCNKCTFLCNFLHCCVNNIQYHVCSLYFIVQYILYVLYTSYFVSTPDRGVKN